MPGRQYVGATGHRYGFNGKEKDDEIKGNGNSLDFGARIYDPRLGRFLSRDPLENIFSEFSPYIFAANNPIALIDWNGEGPILPSAANLAKTEQIIAKDNHFIYRAMKASPNFRTAHMWQFSHNLNFRTGAAVGVVGEGLIAQKMEAAFTAGHSSHMLVKTSFNVNPLSMAKTGTWDVKTTLHNREYNRNSATGNNAGEFTLTFNTASGSVASTRAWSLMGGEEINLFLEVKTLGKNAFTASNIIDGFNQAIKTAKLNSGGTNANNVSVLVVDYESYMYAYSQNTEQFNTLYNELKKNGGELFLPEGHSKEAALELLKLKDAVKSGTTTEGQ